MKISRFTSEENNRSIYLAVRILALLSSACLQGDLLPEMMESETPPPAIPPHEAGDPEVSSRRVSPDLARPEGNPMATRSPRYPALE